MPQYHSWKVEYVGIAPVLDEGQRAVLGRNGVISEDLNDLTANLE
jgi:hypothetical protein